MESLSCIFILVSLLLISVCSGTPKLSMYNQPACYTNPKADLAAKGVR